MRISIATLIAFSLTFVGCSDSDESLQGWKESDVEIVNEGTAPGTSSQIVVPGDATTAPMTGTNFDTTTDLDMITDEQLGLDGDPMREGTDGLERSSVADQVDPATGNPIGRTPNRSVTEQRPEPEPSRVDRAPAQPTTTTRPDPPSPRPAEPEREPDQEPAPPASEDDGIESDSAEPAEEPEPKPEGEDDIQQEESLPPIVIPAPDPPDPEASAPSTTTDATDR